MVSFLFAVFLVLGIFYWVKKREKKQEEKELAEIYRKGAEARARFMAQDALERQMLRQSLEENPRTVAGWEPKLSILTAMSCLTNNWRI